MKKILILILALGLAAVPAPAQKASDMTRASLVESNDLMMVFPWGGSSHLPGRAVSFSNLLENIRAKIAPSGTVPVYFSVRTDGRDGNGTEFDPYNVSTPSRLHARWNTIFSSRQDNKAFIFRPGIYTVTNTMRLTLGGTNIHFIGYGARINMTNANQAYSGSLFGNITTRLTNASWSGFDVDLGSALTFATPPNRVWNGISCEGQDITLKDLTFRNVASTGTDVESFGIIAGITNGSVLNCRVLGMAGPYTSAMAIVGSQIACIGNVIDLGDPGDLVSPWAFGLSIYTSDSVISANIVRNADTGIHMDNTAQPGPWRNNAVTGNFLNAAYPIRIEPSASYFCDWIFSGNVFTTTNRWINAPETGGGGITSNLTFVANTFTGTALATDTMNFNGCETITFNANYFSKQPTFSASSPPIFGVGNIVNGSPNDLAFITAGLTPFATLEIWGANMPVDTANGNRITNYNKVIAIGGFTAVTNTGVITVPKAGYYKIDVTYLPSLAGAAYSGAVRTNNTACGIIAKNYTDASGRGAAGHGIVYLISGDTVSLNSNGTSATIDAALTVTQIR